MSLLFDTLGIEHATVHYARVAPGDMPETLPPGRRCLHVENGEQCVTLLNRYHDSAWCYCHEGQHEAEIADILASA